MIDEEEDFNEEDPDETLVFVSAREGEVILNFTQELDYFCMTPEAAESFANKISKISKEAKRQIQ